MNKNRSRCSISFLMENGSSLYRWKDTFDEMTQHLQNQLKTMHKENAILLIENQRLNAALAKADDEAS